MKRRMIQQGFLVGLVIVLAAAGSARAALTPQEQALVREAKKEGAVTIINPIFADRTGSRLEAAFVKRYGLGEGFRLNNLRKGTGAVVSQVRQEIQAGKLTVDIITVSAPAFFDAAAKRGTFHALDSGYWKDHLELLQKAGQYSSYPYVVVPFAYTFQPAWNAGCPGMKDVQITSYEDLVRPEFKGKLIVTDITKSTTQTSAALGLQESGYDIVGLWRRLRPLDPVALFRTEVKIQRVVSCERPIEPSHLASRVYQNILLKPELKKVLRLGSYKEGHLMLGNQAAVLKGGPGPNAGKLLIEFLLSKEGTDIIVEGEVVYSFRKGYTPPAAVRPYLMDLSKTKLLGLKDWVGNQKDVKKIRDEWLGIFK